MKRHYLQSVFILCLALFNAVTGYAASLLTELVIREGESGYIEILIKDDPF